MVQEDVLQLWKRDMIYIKRWRITDEKIATTKCPWCKTTIRMLNWSPVNCEKCFEELPRYMRLLDEDDIDARIEYHVTGDI